MPKWVSLETLSSSPAPDEPTKMIMVRGSAQTMHVGPGGRLCSRVNRYTVFLVFRSPQANKQLRAAGPNTRSCRISSTIASVTGQEENSRMMSECPPHSTVNRAVNKLSCLSRQHGPLASSPRLCSLQPRHCCLPPRHYSLQPLISLTFSTLLFPQHASKALPCARPREQ